MHSDFMLKLAQLDITNSERAIAYIWRVGLEDHSQGVGIGAIADVFESAGYPKQNQTRLKSAIAKDSRTTKSKDGIFRINIKSRAKLDDVYLSILDSRPIRPSNSVLPAEMYKGSRTYVEKVVAQLNASYEFGTYDCCAVMCRRLLETLIIEVYEAKGDIQRLKQADGNFFMFSGLKSVIENDMNISLSRNTRQGLNDFKRLGDLSAHSRRFNARKDDIDRIADGLRVASEELLHLAGLIRN
jgi:DNA-binding Lrp family transcriptional regulator